MATVEIAAIPESFFEYRGEFQTAIFDAWAAPNVLLKSLLSAVQHRNVSLADFSFAKDPSSVKDAQLSINVVSARAILKVGLEGVIFSAFNPDWADAPNLVELFEVVLKKVLEVGRTELKAQETAMAMHVKPGNAPFSRSMSELVNKAVLGDAETYGISLYRADSTVVMDKSQRYPNSLFVRLNRHFPGETPLSEIAAALYTDESNALKLVGLQELIGGQ